MKQCAGGRQWMRLALAAGAAGVLLGGGQARADGTSDGRSVVMAALQRGAGLRGFSHLDPKGEDKEKGGEGKGEDREEGRRRERPESGRTWFRTELLWWGFRQSSVPPLVTTGTPASRGVFGAPGSHVLLGHLSTLNDQFHGARVAAGTWLDRPRNMGVEGSFGFLGPSSGEFFAASSGAPGSRVLARPFVDEITHAEDSLLIAFPGERSGSIHVDTSSRMEVGDLSFVYNLRQHVRRYHDPNYHLDLLVGPAYYHLSEDLNLDQRSTVLAGQPNAGTRFHIADHFTTDNQLIGGQTGLRLRWRRGRLNGDVFGKIAIGENQEQVDIHGSTLTTDANGSAARSRGGFLALPSNSGSHTRSELAGISQLGANVGYDMTHHLRAVMGVQLLFASAVVRPGTEVPTTINSSHVPANQQVPTGPAAPTFAFSTTDFGAAGINVGLEFRY